MSTRSQRRRKHSSQYRAPQRHAETPAPVSAPIGIIGFGGEQLPWSWLNLTPGEYNPDLSGRAAIDTYHQMLSNDGQIRGICRAIDVPIRSAKWRIDPAPAKTSRDLEIADFVEDNLLNGMAVTWDDALRQMLAARPYGFSVLEKEFAEIDGQIRLVGLWDRIQTTVEKFVYENNRVAGIVQYGTDANGAIRTVTIPADRLLVTTFESRGGNAAGTALLRPMYMPWYIKHPIVKLITIGLENSLVGTVWARVPRSMTDDSRKALRQAIEDLRVRDATGFVLDADVVIEILEGKRNPMDAMPLIEYCDSQMSKVALAQMMDLGTRQSGSGSRAVGDVQSMHFLKSCNADADMVEAVVNRFLIPQLVRLNWPGYGEFPKLRHAEIARGMDLGAVGDALQKLAQGGLLNWTPDVENTIRDWYDMEPLPDDYERPQSPQPSQEQLPAPAVAPAAGDSSDETDPTADDAQQHRDRGPFQEGRCSCGDHFAFADPAAQIGSMFEQTNDAFQAAAGECLRDMIGYLQSTARPLLERLAADGPLARAQVCRSLQTLRLPRQRELLLAIRDYFGALVDAARQTAAEIQGGDVPEISDDLAHYLDAQAQLLAAHLPEQLRTSYIQSILAGTAAELSTSQVVDNAAQAARDRASTDFRQVFTAAVQSLSDQLSGLLIQPDAGAGSSPAGGGDVA